MPLLFNDGSVIEHFRDVMGGFADQLDASRKSLMVRLGTNERRQEKTVDIAIFE